jgi:hypothetical protein
MALPREQARALERLHEEKEKKEVDLNRTLDQMISNSPFITAIGVAVTARLEIEIAKLKDEIDELWTSRELDAFGRPIQGTFGFYWDCSINEEEVPF